MHDDIRSPSRLAARMHLAVRIAMLTAVAGVPFPARGQPPTSTAPSSSAVKSFAVDADKLAAAQQALQQHFADRNDVRIATDPQTSRLYFQAGAQEQQQVEVWLAQWAQETLPGAAATAPPTSVESSAVRPVNHLQVREGNEADGGGEPPLSEVRLENSENAARQVALLRKLGFDVTIEVLADQDVIILRGREHDVARVADIIREIERIARVTKPNIQVVNLRHAANEGIVTIVNDVQESLTQGRQGEVTVRGLGTPNAVLLIGWGDSFEAVLGLIGKLDQPVSPEAELRVFQLQHATATVARSLANQFFANGQGLAVPLRVVADTRTNSIIVHAAPRDLEQIAALLRSVDSDRGAAVQRVRVFPLRHSLAADLVATITTAVESAAGAPSGRSSILEMLTIDTEGEEVVRSGILDQVNFSANAQTNSIVATGPADSMDLIATLIDYLDQPIATAQIKVFRIVNGDANSLVLMLRALLPGSSGNTPRPPLAAEEGETSFAPIRFAVEQRTNSIIATGSASDLRIVEALLLRLDRNETQRRRNTVYRLNNAPAVDVARAINDFLRNQRQVQLVAPGEESPLEQLEREVIVVPEPVSNALVISATARFYDEIINLIEKLDAEPPKVLIQVLIAQVTLDDADEFGVEVGLQDSILFDRSLLGDLITTVVTDSASTNQGVVTSTNEIIQAATNVPGFNFNDTAPLGNSGSQQALAGSGTVGSQGITNFTVGRINNELGFGGLVLSASSESVSVLVRALQESRRLEVLSRPQVMTLDNQPAFIQVGQRVPRITETTLSNFGQTNSVELDNVGLILGVTPRVSPEGTVVMDVDAEKSEVGREADGIPISVSAEGTIIRSPRIDITTAQTTVSAASGETIILGGLIARREFDIHRRVPLLADVPLLGQLFRYDLVQSQRAELLIILTPHIVRGPAEADRLKRIEAARMHWASADVHEIHGDAGLCVREDCPICEAQIPVVHPDLTPRGVILPELNFEQVPPDSLIAPDLLPPDESTP